MADVLKKGVTTALTLEYGEKIMTGDESYSILGDWLSKDQLKEIMLECAGLNLYRDCLRKAYIVKQYMGRGAIVGGRCMAVSKDGSSCYGYHWHPPYEFHAWWQEGFRYDIPSLKRAIVDVGLPGLIMAGSEVSDKFGVMLTGRKPMVIAGMVKTWVDYVPMVEIADHEVT